MNRIISKEDFIRRLETEFGTVVLDSDLRDINSNWHKYTKVAESILPQIPNIGLISSSRKKQRVYREINRIIIESCEKVHSDIDCKVNVPLILEYSSKSYRRVSNAHIDRVVDRIDPEGGGFFFHYMFWPLAFGLGILGLVLGEYKAFDNNTVKFLYVLGWIVLAYLANRKWT